LSRDVVVVLVNHARKRGKDLFDIHELINRSNTAFAAASGSIALADPPDSNALDEETNMRILGVRGRDLKDDILLAVHQGIGKNMETPQFYVDGPYREVKQKNSETNMLESLEELMAETPDGEYVSSQDLATHVGTTRANVKVTLNRVLKRGALWKELRLTAKRARGGGYRLDPV
jgi:hypothetical protein